MMLEHVKATTGFGKITNKRTTSRRHAPSYTYAVHNRQALSLLRQTLPWLKSYKRLRAKLIVENYLEVTPRNGKYSRELLSRKQKFESRVLNIKANREN